MGNFQLKRVTNRIYHLNFDKQVSLTSTFLRFQEYYESPKFKDKVFTLKEFKRWYSKGGKNPFRYYWDWEGFNLPSPMLEPFYDGEFDPLTKNEKLLLSALKHLRGEKFCVVGTYGDLDYSVYEHEVAHGLWFTNDKYRQRASEALKGVVGANRKKLEEMLRRSGYDSSVWEDEKHAYISANPYYLKRIGIGGPDIAKVSNELKFLYNLYLYIQNRRRTAA